MAGETYILVGIAVAMAGLGYILASRNRDAAARIIVPLNDARLAVSAVMAVILLWVALNSGGVVTLTALAALVLLGMAAFLVRDPQTDLSP